MLSGDLLSLIFLFLEYASCLRLSGFHFALSLFRAFCAGWKYLYISCICLAAASPAFYTLFRITCLFIVMYYFSRCTVDVAMNCSTFSGNSATSLNCALCLMLCNFLVAFASRCFSRCSSLDGSCILWFRCSQSAMYCHRHVSTTGVSQSYGGLTAPQLAVYEFGRCSNSVEIFPMNICLQPILFCDAIALLYLVLYLLSCTLPLSSQSVMQLQSVSPILSCTWCWFILSRIWLMLLILHVICDVWMHSRRCSLVSTAPHR